MQGRSIYLTEKEIQALISVVSQWDEMMSSGEETIACVEEDYKSGLGSAMYKLTKCRVSNIRYEKYKSR